MNGKDRWPGLDGWAKHIERKVPRKLWALAKGARTGPPIEAYINHGRWLVDCPYCGGAEFVDYEARRFFCFSCLMEENESKSRQVKFPLKGERERIEELLMLRPFEENRNWLPGETAQDLKDENIEHGLEV